DICLRSIVVQHDGQKRIGHLPTDNVRRESRVAAEGIAIDFKRANGNLVARNEKEVIRVEKSITHHWRTIAAGTAIAAANSFRLAKHLRTTNNTSGPAPMNEPLELPARNRDRNYLPVSIRNLPVSDFA